MRFRVDGKLIRVKTYVVSCGREADSCKKGIWFRVDGRLIRVKRYAVSKICGLVWTGPYRLFLYETRVQATLNNQSLTVSCFSNVYSLGIRPS